MKYWNPINFGLAVFGAAYLLYTFSQTILVEDQTPRTLEIEAIQSPQASDPSTFPAPNSDPRPAISGQTQERRPLPPPVSAPLAPDRPTTGGPASEKQTRPSAFSQTRLPVPSASPRRGASQERDRQRSEDRSPADNLTEEEISRELGGRRLPPGAVGATKRSPSRSDRRGNPRPPRPRSSMSN